VSLLRFLQYAASAFYAEPAQTALLVHCAHLLAAVTAVPLQRVMMSSPVDFAHQPV
jgi:hypothetical protein